MKCPHCGVHYMDGEKRCPMCGKRSGGQGQQKTKTMQSKEWQQAGERAKQHEHLEYYSAPKTTQQPKKKKRKWGWLTFLIGFILTSLIASLLVSFGHMVYDEALNIFFSEEQPVFESCALTEVIPAGSWRTQDGSLMLTVAESSDGEYLTWMRNGSLYTSEYTNASVWNLNADNVSDYYTQDELEAYPLERYTQYSLMADGDKQGDDGIDWAVYRENDVEPEDIDTIDIYDYDAEAYTTLYRVVSSEA